MGIGSFQPVSCDVFITEATFGLPVLRPPPTCDEIVKLLANLTTFPECGFVHVPVHQDFLTNRLIAIGARLPNSSIFPPLRREISSLVRCHADGRHRCHVDADWAESTPSKPCIRGEPYVEARSKQLGSTASNPSSPSHRKEDTRMVHHLPPAGSQDLHRLPNERAKDIRPPRPICRPLSPPPGAGLECVEDNPLKRRRGFSGDSDRA